MPDLPPINHICGEEPHRENEYPLTFTVGDTFRDFEVTHIEHREDNRGDHGVGWFDIYSGKKRLASLNERFTSYVEYEH